MQSPEDYLDSRPLEQQPLVTEALVYILKHHKQRVIILKAIYKSI